MLRQEVWAWPTLIDEPDKFDTLVSCFYDKLAVVETAFVNLLEGVRFLPPHRLKLADIISSLKVSFRYDGMLDADVIEVHSNLSPTQALITSPFHPAEEITKSTGLRRNSCCLHEYTTS